jgi:uncharacterized membrane protein
MSNLPIITVTMDQFVEAQKTAEPKGSEFLMEWLKPTDELNIINVNGVLMPNILSIRTAYTGQLSIPFAQITFHNAQDEMIGKVIIRDRHIVQLVPNKFQPETRYDLVVTPTYEVTT